MTRKPLKIQKPPDYLRGTQLRTAELMSLRLVGAKGQPLSAAIRTSFVGHPSRTQLRAGSDFVDLGQTPLSVVLGTGGGRGGANRLKLLLTLLWSAKSPPYDVRWPNATYAGAIGLDPSSEDDRRTIGRNIRWLETNGFLRAPTMSDDTDNRVILEETLRGREYVPPGQLQGRYEVGDIEGEYHYYFYLPYTFWTDGYIADLDAVEIACLLILLDDLRRRSGPATEEDIWWSERFWRARYGLSDDTRQRGFGGLMDKGIVLRRAGHPIPSLENPLGRHPNYVLRQTRLDGRSIKEQPAD